MISNSPRFSVTVTHLPTGLKVTRNAGHHRTERAAYESAIRYLKNLVAIDKLGQEAEFRLEDCLRSTREDQ